MASTKLSKNTKKPGIGISEILTYSTLNDYASNHRYDSEEEDDESDSASCNSITNPFYDGPQTEVEAKSKIDEDMALVAGVSMPSLDQSPCDEIMYQSPIKNNEMILITFFPGYFKTCKGLLRLIQFLLTVLTLAYLVVAGQNEGGLLNLPLAWHFRIMIFVLVLTMLTSIVFIVANVTSLISVLVVEWNLVDMVLYSVFAFLYLVATSLVASAFDFYQKMKTDVSKPSVHQLLIVVIYGYVAMVLYGSTAVVSYRQWRVQYRLYQRRKLQEEDEIDL